MTATTSLALLTLLVASTGPLAQDGAAAGGAPATAAPSGSVDEGTGEPAAAPSTAGGPASSGEPPAGGVGAEAGGAEAGEPAAPPPDCTDVYDRDDGGCVGLAFEPLEAPGDPVTETKSEPDSLLPFDSNWLGWGLLALGVTAVASATALHGVGYLYSLQLAEAARTGAVGPEDLAATSRVQMGINVSAGVMWIVAALLGGSALALWTFDPETGAVKLPFFGE